MPPRRSLDALLGEMLHETVPEARAEGARRAAALIADVGMRRDPTAADIDELRRILSTRAASKKQWRTRGRRFGRSTSRFLTGLAEGVTEARRKRGAGVATHGKGHAQDREASLIAAHDIRLGLLGEAIGDPALMAALDVYDEAFPAERHRQFLFVEAVYRTYLLEWRVGVMTRQELFGKLRIFFHNRIVLEYWEATRSHRASLDQSSDEAAIGRMADMLVLELMEADTEEWWVVGEPPRD
ncbi:DUF6082 family protein [Streptomyces sp. KL116D]|uniref:DUF6082 family protein n=1 Tax=Streptomyces sp. KL116D TaxID=3045152 RepID=UPI003558C2D1